MFGAAKRDRAFKDYCLILQVHPEADAAMVDAAYWHLAKRYNEAAAYDPKAKAKLEELNEAYIVLGSAERREAYMKIRVEVLGEGALPEAPRPAPAAPPLAMMSRQRPQEHAAAEMESKPPHSVKTRKAIGMFVLLRLAGVVLASETSLIIATTVEGAAGFAILAVLAVVASLQRLRVARSEGIQRPKSASLPKVRAPGDPLDKIKAQAELVRHIVAKPEDGPVDIKPARGVDADQLHELELPAGTASVEPAVLPDVALAPSEDVAPEPQPRQQAPEGEPFKHAGHDPLDKIKRQAAEFRRIAESQGEVKPDVAQGDATQDDPDQLEKIKQQTERLKSIAAKFNAAKAKTSSEPSQED